MVNHSGGEGLPVGTCYYFLQLQGAACRSKSAPHMYVLVCICSNTQQFSQLVLMKHLSSDCAILLAWPCFVDQNNWPAFHYNVLNVNSRPLLSAGTQSARSRSGRGNNEERGGKGKGGSVGPPALLSLFDTHCWDLHSNTTVAELKGTCYASLPWAL